MGENPFLDILHMRSIHPDRNVVLRLAGNRTGMTADALAIVDGKAVIHVALFLPHSKGSVNRGRPGSLRSGFDNGTRFELESVSNMIDS